jgi:hypothetical protein
VAEDGEEEKTTTKKTYSRLHAQGNYNYTEIGSVAELLAIKG